MDRHPVISKQMLMSYSLEVCDICGKTFENKYDNLIHNATHIIIPLLRFNYLQCDKCSFQCTLQKDLHQHIIVQHSLIIKTERLNYWDGKEIKNPCERKVTSKIDTADQNINERIEININKPPILQNGVSDCTKAKSTLQRRKIITNNEINASPEVKMETKPVVSENNVTSIKKPSVRDRLIFEDEDFLDDLSNISLIENLFKSNNTGKSKLPSQSQSTMTTHFKCNGGTNDCKTEVDSNVGCDDIDTPLIFFNKEKTNLNDMHYEVLRQPSKTSCRYCSAMFNDRFSLIIHEQKHIKFKQKILGLLCLHCDKYIAGNYINLTRHIEAQHSKDRFKMYCTSVCKKCGLEYRSYKHHMLNYHSSKCCNINKFVTNNHFKNHLDKCLCHSHVLSVCRQCYKILQEDVNLKCVTLGMKRTSSSLQDCKKCNNKVNEIVTVKLSSKIEPKYQYWYVQDRPISNKDRLKNIRMRLKKLNIMSKIYFVFFFDFFTMPPIYLLSRELGIIETVHR